MKEDFLHYLWKYKKFDFAKAKTTSGDSIEVLRSGEHNSFSGPDFFNAQLRIGNQLWAGNVEIHLKASDWYAHNHENDMTYANVILHIVWEDDVSVYNSSKVEIPTLRLRDYVSIEMLGHYNQLFVAQPKRFIVCEQDTSSVPQHTMLHWVERLYIERLEQKVIEIEQLLAASKNDWEAVLFKLLAKNFGTKINGAAFLSMASTIPFSVIRKLASEAGQLETLFYGVAELFPDGSLEPETQKQIQDYNHITAKFKLESGLNIPVQYFKLRPPNFPTIRLSQLANIYYKEQNLFSKVVALKSKGAFYDLFAVQASTFWDTHYNFGKTHAAKPKKVSKSFIDLVLINTILPLKFAYARYRNTYNEDEIFDLVCSLEFEKNSITKRFQELTNLNKDALHSQAFLQLYNAYCTKKKCLQCAIGMHLLSKTKSGVD